MAGDPETSASSPSPGGTARARDLSALSFSLGTAGGLPPRAGDVDVDVAICGAGYTGLWTAYSLAAADPALRIAVIEAEIAGFGASGRHGGWRPARLPMLSAAPPRL